MLIRMYPGAGNVCLETYPSAYISRQRSRVQYYAHYSDSRGENFSTILTFFLTICSREKLSTFVNQYLLCLRM